MAHDDDNAQTPTTFRNAAMAGAAASPFLGLIGQRRLLHDPVTNAAVQRMSKSELAALARPGDVVLTGTEKFNPFKTLQTPFSGTDFFHTETVVSPGKAFTSGRLTDPALKGLSSASLRTDKARDLNFRDMVLLRPHKALSPEELERYLGAVTKSTTSPYGYGQAVKSYLHDLFVPKIPLFQSKGGPLCTRGTCSTMPAQAFASVGKTVLPGVTPSLTTPADFLRSEHFFPVAASIKSSYANTLAHRMKPYASRLALGGALAGAVYGGSKLWDQLRSHGEGPKTAAYRFKSG